MEGMGSATDVESILTTSLDHVFIARNTGSLQSRGSQLLLLVRHQMGNERKVIHVGLLSSAVEDSDLGVGDTSTKPTLNVGFVLLESGATSRS
jgi:hypothetical protein